MHLGLRLAERPSHCPLVLANSKFLQLLTAGSLSSFPSCAPLRLSQTGTSVHTHASNRPNLPPTPPTLLLAHRSCHEVIDCVMILSAPTYANMRRKLKKELQTITMVPSALGISLGCMVRHLSGKLLFVPSFAARPKNVLCTALIRRRNCHLVIGNPLRSGH